MPFEVINIGATLVLELLHYARVEISAAQVQQR